RPQEGEVEVGVLEDDLGVDLAAVVEDELGLGDLGLDLDLLLPAAAAAEAGHGLEGRRRDDRQAVRVDHRPRELDLLILLALADRDVEAEASRDDRALD